MYMGEACKKRASGLIDWIYNFFFKCEMKWNENYLDDVPVGCDAGDGLCHVWAMRAEKHDERSASSRRRRRLGPCLIPADSA
jgi:hypothetical protein